jgi:hypothetical protein
MTAPATDRDALRIEALRINRRYVLEVVEALGFCPWATAARLQGRVQTRIVFGREPELDTTLREIEALERVENTDIGLLVFPEASCDRIAFQHFAAKLRERYEQQRRQRPEAFALADFHPAAEPDTSSPARLVPFIRRSPDPTLQLVRHSVLAAARRGESEGTRFLDAATLSRLDLVELSAPSEPLHARIARANLGSVLRLGVEQVTAVLDDIARDRDHSYARLGLTPPPWSPRRVA